MYEWHSFLWTADEWFITYSLPPQDLVHVKLFAIGHTVELYLKAANTKITGNIDGAIKFGHNIKAIWDDCKSHDKKFMPNFEIRDCVFNTDLFTGEIQKRLSGDDLKNYFHNQELYTIAKLLPDLKYLGAPLKSIKGQCTLGSFHPNPYWINFLRELRAYLEYPQKDKVDIIKHHIYGGDLPAQSIDYLKGLYA